MYTTSYGEKHIYGALTRYHRLGRGQLFAVGTAAAHGPFLHKCERHFLFARIDDADLVNYRVLSREQLLYGAVYRGRDHYLMADDLRLVDISENVAAGNLGAGFDACREFPLFLSVKRRQVYAPLNVGAADLSHFLERTLNSVVYVGNYAGAQLNGEGRARGNDLFAASQSGSLLIDLYGCAVPVHLDDLTDELVLADANHVEHICFSHALGNDERTRYFYYLSFNHAI